MIENYYKDSDAVERLRSGPLGPHLDSAVTSLVGEGYTASTVRSYLWAAGNFGRWLAANGHGADDVDEQIVGDYLDERRLEGKLHRSQRRAAHHVLDHLREKGVVPKLEPAVVESPIDRLLVRYERHLRVERGLSEATVVNYRPSIHRFLVERFGDEPLRLRELRPADVSRFLVRQARTLSHGRARVMTAALRSLFRFLLQNGEIELDLAASVLSVAGWRQGSVPKYLTPKEVERLLEACDQNTGSGRRNYAILLLLARLGLRAGEVVALELDDIDWRTGEIMVPGKGNRREGVPLPSDVGEALAAYLRQDRPSCATRRVFIRTRAPHRGLANPSTVSTLVRRALEQADLHPPTQGAHLLRHSLATRLLREGASMAEIGQLLRHRSPSTTEIYAKVDFDGLRSLALPWPSTGGVR
ncbi:site-specific integrase [bacterium]|nr:site-specific integrase [bacterium]